MHFYIYCILCIVFAIKSCMSVFFSYHTANQAYASGYNPFLYLVFKAIKKNVFTFFKSINCFQSSCVQLNSWQICFYSTQSSFCSSSIHVPYQYMINKILKPTNTAIILCQEQVYLSCQLQKTPWWNDTEIFCIMAPGNSTCILYLHCIAQSHHSAVSLVQFPCV